MSENQAVTFSSADRLYTFGVWVEEIGLCIRRLREYKEENVMLDVPAFLNLHLSCGMNDQFSEMKKMWQSFSEEEQPGWYSLQQLNRDKAELEELSGIPLG